MKKLTGWILIIFCSILLLIFAIALIAIIPGVLNKSSEVQMSIKEILTSSVGFLIVISLLIIGLKNGIKKIKKEKVVETIDYDGELKIDLTGQIEYIDYRNLILGISFKKPIYIVVLGILLLFSLTFVVNRENMMNQLDSNYFIFIIIGVFLLSPFFTLIQIKRLYNTNSIFKEELNYILTNDSIQIKGETVDSTQKWTHFYQIRETKKFFMFYHGKMIATLIDKKMFLENDLQEFQRFTKSLRLKRL
ncbi:YcxB family protein [Geofilum rhodophaeum]|uniref:YcxB family protein n=1 Tax=Geofilum rhodophaeum TaxID=1965019 RepID=UPI000B524B01|nr:YcxB family protein [Geofilum rhodophaeum]